MVTNDVARSDSEWTHEGSRGFTGVDVDRTVTIPDDPLEFGGLIVPGLLAAGYGHGVAELGVAHLAAAAHAVALVTPTLHVLPELNDPRLVSAIAHYVSQTLADQHR